MDELALTTRDTFSIAGRGVVHVVELPEEYWRTTDPRSLVGGQVRLDGRSVVVRGVETPALLWRPELPGFRRVGLMI